MDFKRKPSISLSRTNLNRVLIFTLLISISTTAFGASITTTSSECFGKMENDSEICFSPSCIHGASNLLNSMDMSVDPCTDFYSFVCGNWIKNTYLTSSYESPFTSVHTSIKYKVRDLLEDLGKKKFLPEHKKKIRDFYKSCMNVDYRHKIGAKELLLDLKKFGGWPIIDEDWSSEDFNWVDLMIQLFKDGHATYNIFFSIIVDVDVKNTSRSIISINQPSLGLYGRKYYIEGYHKLMDLYKDVIFKLAKKLNADIDKEESMKDIEDALSIEKRIAELIKDIDLRYPGQYYNIETLEELEISAPKVPWRRLLQDLLPLNTELASSERIIVQNPSLIRGLNNLFEEMDNATGKRILANYMFYRIVLKAANYLRKDFHDLTNKVFDASVKLEGIPWESCAMLTTTLFTHSVVASYADKYMDIRTKDELEILFEALRNSLMDRIRSAEWFDDVSKDLALLKITNIQAAFAYVNESKDDEKLNSLYKDVKITENHYNNIKQIIAFKLRRHLEGLHETRTRFKWTNVEIFPYADALYRYIGNAITISFLILEGTTFSADLPNYMKYGGFGTLLGHELSHAFDSVGRFYDDEGNYRVRWSNASFHEHSKRMICYQDQYSNYYLKIGDSKFLVNGRFTLDENVSDHIGLQIAYKAYTELLQKMGSEKILPGLPFNEKQIFWISFASTWCKKGTDSYMLNTIMNSAHTPSNFRVIGSLSNMKEFSEDFGCESNSTMHPVTRCSLWD